jgi:tetratricopeptide (TPR) repeat protein
MSESILWNEMGNLHMRLGSFEDAISAYGRAIELSPKFGLAYSNLGHAYYSKGKFDNAISLFQKSIELSVSNQEQSITWKRLGDVYQKLGDYEKALAAYKMGDELDAATHAPVGSLMHESTSTLMVEPVKVVAEQELEPEIIEEDEEEAFQLAEGDGSPNGMEGLPIRDEDGGDDKIDDQAESMPPATPPFLPALDIPEDELPSPEPETASSATRTVEDISVTPEAQLSTEEEFGELDNWLQSLDRQPSSDLLIQPSAGFEKAASVSEADSSPQGEAMPDPNIESSFVMLDMDSAVARSPYLATQDSWESSEPGAQPQQPQNALMVLDQPTTQIVELEKNNRTELFKSWRLSEAPEHDPDIWKCMIEALEKGQAEEKPVLPPKEQGCDVQVESHSPEQPPIEKSPINRELLEGIENYRKITSMAPGNDKAWDTLGKLLKDAGEFSEAISAFEHAISLCPQKDLYHYHLGLVYAAQKRHDEAILSFQRVIDLNPGYTLAHCALAGSYRRSGMEAEAEQHIKVALPRLESETEYNRACFEAICGNTDHAIELLSQALEKNQTSPDWVRGDPDLDFIREDPRFKSLVGA